MLKTKIIGCGFGGTKAAISDIETGVVDRENVMIVNSTLKDIPQEYEDIAAYYSRAYGGSAKERSSGKELCLDALQNDDAFIKKIDGFVDPDTELLIIKAAPGGGTGSSSAPILAKYYSTVIAKANPKLRIQVQAVNGFEDDSRELQNTIEFFQELNELYTVQAISLKKIIDDSEGLSRTQCELLADNILSDKTAICSGRHINYTDARHIMDESDLLKLSTTPGFMLTFRVSFNKLKNEETFNKLIIEAIDNNKSLEIAKPGFARLGVITNISEKTESMINYTFPTIKNRLGNYYEIFIHDNAYDGGDEYVEFIVAGLAMPIDDLKEVYEKYKRESEAINTERDSFFSELDKFRGGESASLFNVGANKKILESPTETKLDKGGFFSEFQLENTNSSSKEQINTRDDFFKQEEGEKLQTKEVTTKYKGY